MASPLDDLQQQIYDSRNGVQTRYLVLSRVRNGEWGVTLWAPDADEPDSPNVWAGLGDETRAGEVADAISQGLLSIADRNGGGKKLLIHTTKSPVSVYLDAVMAQEYIGDLLSAAFSLVSRPVAKNEGSDVRVLAAQLEERDATISALHSQLRNLKANIQRHNGSSGRNDTGPNTPPKKVLPVNASRLQPNQKRRKIVEDEFVGSSSEEESDEDEDN